MPGHGGEQASECANQDDLYSVGAGRYYANRKEINPGYQEMTKKTSIMLDEDMMR